ncbi:MAG: hypothetical protein KDA78_02985 [Planctomycetaceae bacterium]|nr:hypothetical protein [Planctomycetaceae bacterium]
MTTRFGSNEPEVSMLQYLAGELSEQEAAQFESQLIESESTQETFSDLAKVLLVVDELPALTVASRHAGQNLATPHRSWAQLAATFLVGALLGGFAVHWQSQPEQNLVEQSNQSSGSIVIGGISHSAAALAENWSQLRNELSTQSEVVDADSEYDVADLDARSNFEELNEVPAWMIAAISAQQPPPLPQELNDASTDAEAL